MVFLCSAGIGCSSSATGMIASAGKPTLWAPLATASLRQSSLWAKASPRGGQPSRQTLLIGVPLFPAGRSLRSSKRLPDVDDAERVRERERGKVDVLAIDRGGQGDWKVARGSRYTLSPSL